MQIKGNFDLTVIITGVGIPTTLREIGWPKASFAKASFSQFWSTIPSQTCQLLEIRTWFMGPEANEGMNETFNERYMELNDKSLTTNNFCNHRDQWKSVRDHLPEGLVKFSHSLPL